jgi:hypothetical protein
MVEIKFKETHFDPMVDVWQDLDRNLRLGIILVMIWNSLDQDLKVEIGLCYLCERHLRCRRSDGVALK